MGQWVERGGSWIWDPTPADPSVTRILPTYSGGPAMSEHDPIPSSPEVYDPRLGHDGGGWSATGDIPTLDPDEPAPFPWHGTPAEHEIARPWPADPAVTQYPQDMTLREDDPAPAEAVCCETCGTYVHPSRIRG